MAQAITWMIVKNRDGTKEIGAVAFLGDDIAAVVSFYAEADFNKDGKVSLREKITGMFPISIKGTASAEVVSRAREHAELMIDNYSPVSRPGALPGAFSKAKKLRHLQGELLMKVGLNMALDGMFKAYLTAGLRRTGVAIGIHINAGMVKTILINTAIATATKEALDAAVKPLITP